jgi:beta-lactamase regulating signal transducer with metallopeptidase domain
MVLLKSSIIQLLGIWVAVSCLSGLLIFLILKFFDIIFSNQSSTDKYHKNIVAVLFFFFINMAATFYVHEYSFQNEKQKVFITESAKISSDSTAEVSVEENRNELVISNLKRNEQFSLESLLKYLGIFWMIGAIVFTIKMMGGYFYTRSLLMSSQQSIPEKWSHFIIDKLEKLNIKKDVKVFESSSINSVFTFGFFKPMIVLPIGFFTTIPQEQIEAVLWHELYHIKYKDYLVNLMTMTFEIIFFYHPVMWWLSKNIRIERENRCDDQVTKLTDKKVYAHALLNMESYRQSLSYAIPFSTKPSNLKMRIMRIFEQKPERNMGLKPFLSILVLVVFLMSFTFYKLEQPKTRSESSQKKLLKETKVGAGDLRKSSEDVLFKSENSHLGVVLEMTQNTLIAKSENKNVKLVLDGKSKALNKLHPFGENQIATMFTVEKEASYYFFTRKYFENHDREKWEKDHENRNTYVFDRSTEFFTFQPAKKSSNESKVFTNERSKQISSNTVNNSTLLHKLNIKSPNLSSFEIFGPLTISSGDSSQLIDSTNLELLKKLVKKYDSDDDAEVEIKIDGKTLAEGANIKKALGVREIMKIKIVAPSKDAETGLIEIYTKAVLDSSDSKRSDKSQIENIDTFEEEQADSIQVYFESKKLNYSGQVKYNATKTSVLDALGFSDDDPLFVLDGKIVGSKFNIKNIKPNNIERINVLKDKKAIDKYGDKAKNGVVEIYLKEE